MDFWRQTRTPAEAPRSAGSRSRSPSRAAGHGVPSSEALRRGYPRAVVAARLPSPRATRSIISCARTRPSRGSRPINDAARAPEQTLRADRAAQRHLIRLEIVPRLCRVIDRRRRRSTHKTRGSRGFLKGGRRDSNPRPPGPQPGALPTELRPPSQPGQSSNGTVRRVDASRSPLVAVVAGRGRETSRAAEPGLGLHGSVCSRPCPGGQGRRSSPSPSYRPRAPNLSELVLLPAQASPPQTLRSIPGFTHRV